MSSLKKLAIRGTIWTIVGYGGSQALRLGGNIILTRLLVPEMFGLIALVNTFITGLNLFSDIGIQPSIIRSSRWNEPAFLNTAWTLQVIRGWLLWLASLAIAWPVAQFYRDSQLLWILPVIGLTTVFQGYNSTALVTINRELKLGLLTTFEFAIQTLSLVITIIWAYFRQTIWALAGGSLISSLLKAIWSHRLVTKTQNNFDWDKKAIREIISFGKWIFISTIMTFLAEQTDRLMLSKLLSFEMLGIYTIAWTFADMPRQVSGQVIGRVIFPIFSQLYELPREVFREQVLAKRWLLLIGSAIFIAFLTSFGDFLILSLYDSRYSQAAWMLPILALGMWPFILLSTNGNVLFVIGKPIYVAFGNSLKFIYMLVGLPIGVAHLGVLGAVIIIAFNDIFLYGAVNYGLWREGLSGFWQDIKTTILFVLFVILLLTTRHILGLGSPFSAMFTGHYSMSML